jgi:hypothetical protein
VTWNTPGHLFQSIFGRKTKSEKEVTWNTPGRDQLPKIKVEPMFRDKLEHILKHPPPEPDPSEREDGNTSAGESEGAHVSTLDTSTLDTSGFGQYDVQPNSYAPSPTRSAADPSETVTSDSDSAPVRSHYDIRLYAGALNYNELDTPKDSSAFDSSTYDTYETYETIAFSAESSVSDVDWPSIRDITRSDSASTDRGKYELDNRLDIHVNMDKKAVTGKRTSLEVPALDEDRRGSIRSNSSKKSVTFGNAPVYIDAEPAPDYEEEQVPTATSSGQDSRMGKGPAKPKDTIRLREIYGKPIVSSTAVAKVNPIYVEDVMEETEEEKEQVSEPEVALSVKDYIHHVRIEKYKLKTDIKNNNQPGVDVKGKEPQDIDGIWIIDRQQVSFSPSFFERKRYIYCKIASESADR